MIYKSLRMIARQGEIASFRQTKARELKWLQQQAAKLIYVQQNGTGDPENLPDVVNHKVNVSWFSLKLLSQGPRRSYLDMVQVVFGFGVGGINETDAQLSGPLRCDFELASMFVADNTA